MTDTGRTAGEPEDIGSSLATLVGLLPGDETFDETLQRIVSLADRTIPGCAAASVTLVDRSQPGETVTATGDIAKQADEAQYERDLGPCLDASRESRLYHVRDMAAETRWADYPAAALDAGVGSSLSVPLAVRATPLGALNLYAREAGAFGDEALEKARLFAEQASVAVANAKVVDAGRRLAMQLQEAMRSRAVIEQAKGVLVAERGCDPEAAFELLKAASQRENVKLRDIAERIVASKVAREA